MIIAVDFDGTLYLKGKPNKALFDQVIQWQRQGNCVILWTCREGKSLAEAVKFCKRNGFTPNLVNQNARQAVAMMGHDSRKIYADLYIDDKNIR